ncbi:MAG TPA: hypothetical protein VLT36_12995 [Candidatus Dormibacteraeota bacterium]|nr:hypothetical protein [Candidatus Dormibacteraeota bacterium]
MEKRNLLIDAVRATEGLPAALREQADKVEVCEDEVFDESGIQSALEDARSLNTSQPDRAELLKKWTALKPFCNVALLQGAVWTQDRAFNFWVDPRTSRVVHCYEWSGEKFKAGKQLIDLRNQYEALNHKSKG